MNACSPSGYVANKYGCFRALFFYRLLQVFICNLDLLLPLCFNRNGKGSSAPKIMLSVVDMRIKS